MAELAFGDVGSPCDLDRVERLAQAMRIDDMTLTVLAALRNAGAQPILLKGPVVCEWLYDGDRTQRGYNDADILVAPQVFSTARAVLRDLGFGCTRPVSIRLPGQPHRHAECWFRASDHSAIDLHRALHYTEHIADERVWDVVSRDLATIELFNTKVDVPSEAVRALQAVLHLRAKDRPGSRAWVDVEHAVDQVAPEVWRRAAQLARELGVESEMGSLLGVVPQGRLLAESLRLPIGVPPYLLVTGDSATSIATRFMSQVRQLGWRRGAALVARKLVPTADYVRCGWPVARRGPLHLVAMYAWRLLLIPHRLAGFLPVRPNDRQIADPRD